MEVLDLHEDPAPHLTVYVPVSHFCITYLGARTIRYTEHWLQTFLFRYKLQNRVIGYSRTGLNVSRPDGYSESIKRCS